MFCACEESVAVSPSFDCCPLFNGRTDRVGAVTGAETKEGAPPKNPTNHVGLSRRRFGPGEVES